MRIISGTLRNQTVTVPKGDAVRPTSEKLRAALFNICQHEVAGSLFLDLFAGSGAMGFEALSRGAAEVTFVEQDREVARCIRHNAQKFHVEAQIRLLQGNALQLLHRLFEGGKKFDLIYVDPPYYSSVTQGDSQISFCQKVLQFMDDHSLLLPQGGLFLEGVTSSLQKEVDKELKNIYLKSERRFGHSVLKEYRLRVE